MAKFKVPVSGHGAVVVKADDKDEAFNIARERVSQTDVDFSLDIDGMYREMVSEVDSDRKAFDEETDYESKSASYDGDIDIPEFGSVNDLRKARKELGIQQQHVACFLGVDSTTVSAWEREYSNISLSQAREYRDFLQNYKDLDL